MPTLTIDGTRYRIPAGWHEVTLDHYIYYKEHEEDAVATVARLCDIPEEVLQMNPAAIYRALRKKLDWFFTSLPSEKPTNVFWFEGVRYDFAGEHKAITLAQSIDIDSWVEDFISNPTKAWPYLVACLYTPSMAQPRGLRSYFKLYDRRPRPTPYDSKEAETRGIAFHALPLSVALPIVTFFLSRIERLRRLTETLAGLYPTRPGSQVNGKPLPSTGAGSLPSTI